jgi:hypothetical protein
MDVFVFAGSTAGATRTSSSVLLAAGTKSLGLEPLHIQVLTDGGFPAIVDVTGVPFATSTIKAKRGELITERLRARARSRRGTSLVIVDMPAQDILETLLMFSGMHPRILVPMPNWAADPGRAVSDFRMLQDQREGSLGGPQQASRTDPGSRQAQCMAPSGWLAGGDTTHRSHDSATQS